MNLTTEEKRERHRTYMRHYRNGVSRSEEGKRYWRENKEKIMAKRREKPRTEKDRERGRIYARRWREKNPQKVVDVQKKYNTKNPGRSWRLKQRKQEAIAGRIRPEVCEICDARESGRGRRGNGRIAFDHCHQTGAFRGWLCSHCNKAIGFAKNDPGILRKMIAYLEKSTKFS